jgi:hypothetical protein
VIRRFVLEDDPSRLAHFRALFPGCVTAETYRGAVAALRGERFDEVYLDHDIPGDKNGCDVAYWMTTKLARRRRPRVVVVHSLNRAGAMAIRLTLEGAGFTVASRPYSPTWALAEKVIEGTPPARRRPARGVR